MLNVPSGVPVLWVRKQTMPQGAFRLAQSIPQAGAENVGQKTDNAPRGI